MSISLRHTTSSDQDKEPKPRFEELDQNTFHQDLQPPDLCPRSDFCSLCEMLVSLFVVISVFLWLMYGLTYNGLKALSLVNRTLDISLLNLANNSLFSINGFIEI